MPFQADEGVVEKLTKDGKDGLMDAEHDANAHVHSETEPPFSDGLRAEIARGRDGHRPPHIRCSLLSLIVFGSHYRRGRKDPTPLAAHADPKTDLPRGVEPEQERWAHGSWRSSVERFAMR